MLISSVLCSAIMADLVNAVPVQNWRGISPGGRHPRTVVIRPPIPTSPVKVEVVIPRINEVIRYSDRNIHIKRRGIYELGRFININLWRLRRLVIINIRWLRRFVSINLRRRCGGRRLSRRCRYAGPVSRHLIPIGIHALDIGIVLSALCLPAINTS